MRSSVSLLFCLLLACAFAKPLPLDARNAADHQDKTPKIYDVVNVDGTSNLNLRAPPPLDENKNIDSRSPKKSYSVVNVDGDATETPEPTTVVLTSTAVITASAIPTTQVIVSTEEPQTQTLVYTVTVDVSNTPAPTTNAGAAPSETQPSVIVVTTTVSPTDTTSYYDNGMWHTYYPVKTWPTDGPAPKA
ncbi:uncharacterized protein J3D65DRAFT_475920 [Phyllosticta citribraziliensis]|uniref:Uncharacterized protein n=1 Tax=Phyllosticta citribraziliensis TaxID=989973 RepID=A0ABR1LG15_9PEZI